MTPPRWLLFDEELESAFEAILDAMESGDMPRIAKTIMIYSYYWYNFMPLARGTAACGYATMLSLFWTAGMPVDATIPVDYQVDWEAILSQHPDDFEKSVGKWLYPEAARKDGGGHDVSNQASPKKFPNLVDMPEISETLPTLRHRISALNYV